MCADHRGAADIGLITVEHSRVAQRRIKALTRVNFYGKIGSAVRLGRSCLWRERAEMLYLDPKLVTP